MVEFKTFSLADAYGKASAFDTAGKAMGLIKARQGIQDWQREGVTRKRTESVMGRMGRDPESLREAAGEMQGFNFEQSEKLRESARAMEDHASQMDESGREAAKEQMLMIGKVADQAMKGGSVMERQRLLGQGLDYLRSQGVLTDQQAKQYAGKLDQLPMYAQMAKTGAQIFSEPKAPSMAKDASGFQRYTTGPEAGKRVFPKAEKTPGKTKRAWDTETNKLAFVTEEDISSGGGRYQPVPGGMKMTSDGEGGFSLTMGDQALGAGTELTKRDLSKVSMASTEFAADLAAGADLMGRLRGMGAGVSGFRGAIGEAGGAISSVPGLGAAGELVTETATGVSQRELAGLKTDSRAYIAKAIPEMTGEKGSRVTGTELAITQDALKVIETAASHEQVLGAMETALAAKFTSRVKIEYMRTGKALYDMSGANQDAGRTKLIEDILRADPNMSPDVVARAVSRVEKFYQFLGVAK